MIKNTILFAGIVGMLFFWTEALQARFSSVEPAAKPVVVELFTSQSCSSCPPADRLLGEISKNDNVIALGFHVTYWNHLHWEDTLSDERSTQRQRNYAAVKGSGRVYTPQMIVNGSREFVGSNRSRLNSAISQASDLQPITLRKTGTDSIEITLPNIPQDGALNYTLRLFGTKDSTQVKIQRGENRGRSVSYSNAVVHQETIGSWLGRTETRTLKLPQNTEIDSLIILAQTGGFGEIVAAGKISK